MKRLAAVLLFFSTAVLSGHAQSTSVVIRGRVVADETGQPLPHARVVIYNDAAPLPAIFTDAEGRFASAPMPVGRHHLSASKPGYVLTSAAGLDAALAEGVDVRMPRSASIAGRVVDPNGDPVAGLAVSVGLPRGSGGSAGATIEKIVSTDDLGEYRAGGLAPDTYVVAVNMLLIDPSGSVDRVTSFFPGVTEVGEAQRITLAPGDQKTGVDFAGVTNQVGSVAAGAQLLQGNVTIRVGNPQRQPLDPQKGTATIRGRITRGDGLPLAHATVATLVPAQTTGGARTLTQKSVTTDDDGTYEFAELPPGEYRFSASKPGFMGTAYGQRSADDRAETVTVGDNQTRTQIDISLPRFGTVTGQIFDDFGDPVDGATVSASQIRFQAGRRRLVVARFQTTDDLGRYRIPGLAPGQYILTASIGQVSALAASADVSGFAPTYFPGTTNAVEARPVAVARSQDVVGVDVALVPLPTARILGTKIGSDGTPLGGSLMLTPSERSGAIVTPGTGARIEPDGRFEFPNVAPGEYVIQADQGRRGANGEGEFVSQFVTVNGTDVKDVELRASPGSIIRGRVSFDADASPPARGFAIVPERADPDRTPLGNGSIARAEMQADLTFELTGIHGPRRLELERPPAGWSLKAVLANGVDVTDAALPFGTADESLSDVQIVVTNHVTELSGTVADSRGRATRDYTLLVFPLDRERWYPGSRYLRRVSPEAAGNFTVRGLPPADYFVAPVAGARLFANGDDGWQDPDFLESIALRAARATLTEAQKLSVSARLITP